jgi:hypothetical protein
LLSGLFKQAICIDIPPAIMVQRQALRKVFDGNVMDSWRFSESELSGALSRFVEAEKGVMLLLPHQGQLIHSLPKPTFFYCNDIPHELTKVSRDEVISVATRSADVAFSQLLINMNLKALINHGLSRLWNFPKRGSCSTRRSVNGPVTIRCCYFR